MSDIEVIKKLVENKYGDILLDFDKVLEQYYLSELEVIGVKLGIKDEQTKVSKEAILKEFNKALETNGLEGLFVSSFTLTKKTGREGFCEIEVKGSWITIRC